MGCRSRTRKTMNGPREKRCRLQKRKRRRSIGRGERASPGGRRGKLRSTVGASGAACTSFASSPASPSLPDLSSAPYCIAWGCEGGQRYRGGRPTRALLASKAAYVPRRPTLGVCSHDSHVRTCAVSLSPDRTPPEPRSCYVPSLISIHITLLSLPQCQWFLFDVV